MAATRLIALHKNREIRCGLSEKPHGLRPEPGQDTAGRTGQQLRMQSLDG